LRNQCIQREIRRKERKVIANFIHIPLPYYMEAIYIAYYSNKIWNLQDMLIIKWILHYGIGRQAGDKIVRSALAVTSSL